ncbi:hypothetical protein AB2T85_05590 [Clostridium butyricum]|uniref:hypothetical protein n=1 Tax=Clostridium butyricum TaxID=1492 RepID=UPI0034654D39
MSKFEKKGRLIMNIRLQPPVRDLKNKLNKALYSNAELHNVKYGNTKVSWILYKKKDGYYARVKCNDVESMINLHTKDITIAQYIIASSIRSYTKISVAYFEC